MFSILRCLSKGIHSAATPRTSAVTTRQAHKQLHQGVLGLLLLSGLSIGGDGWRWVGVVRLTDFYSLGLGSVYSTEKLSLFTGITKYIYSVLHKERKKLIRFHIPEQ